MLSVLKIGGKSGVTFVLSLLATLQFSSLTSYATFYNFESTTVPSEFIVTSSPIDSSNVGTTTLRSHDGNSSLGIGVNTLGNNWATVELNLTESLSSGEISWWQYDEYAMWSPYYMFVNINSQDNYNILGLTLHDLGWNYVGSSASTTNNFNAGDIYFHGPTRVANTWSKYEVRFNNDIENIYVNDIFVGSYAMGGHEVSSISFTIANNYGGPNQYQIDSLSIIDTSAAAVPEPSTLLLLAGGLAGLGIWRLKTKAA